MTTVLRRGTVTLSCAPIVALVTSVLAGCQFDRSMGGLMPSQSALVVALDESGSAWQQARRTATALAPVYLSPRNCGPQSALSLLVGGRGTEWAFDSYGSDYLKARGKLLQECSSAGKEGELGTDVCAMLRQVTRFVRTEERHEVTAIIVSDFVADPARNVNGQVTVEYADPAAFRWTLHEASRVHLRIYFTSDLEMARLMDAWEEGLSQVDVRYFRPSHVPAPGDLEPRTACPTHSPMLSAVSP